VIRYALRRALEAAPILLGVATLVFFMLHMAPGDPTAIYFGPGMSPEAMDQIRRNLGLDDPLLLQYFRWLGTFLTGDFGYSFSAGIPVRDRVFLALSNTLVLSMAALLLSFLAGIVIGIVQAVRQNSILDSALNVLTLFFHSMPSFWLAIMLILVFSVGAGGLWDWPISFPVSGVTGSGYELMDPLGRFTDRLYHLALPLLALTLVLTGGISRYVRSSMLEVISQDYIRTARAKGLSEKDVILKHALRNALIPVVSLFGLYLPLLLSGAVFVEVVFAWPGMGKLMVDSIAQRDYPVVLAGTFLFGAVVVAGNLMADLLYGVVDPRIRQGGRRDD
jgi:peptide/nickel transport system permease protein